MHVHQNARLDELYTTISIDISIDVLVGFEVHVWVCGCAIPNLLLITKCEVIFAADKFNRYLHTLCKSRTSKQQQYGGIVG